MDPADQIRGCVQAMHRHFRTQFILLGGAAILLFGSTRITEDVDILVPSDTNLSQLEMEIRQIEGFTKIDGKLCFVSFGVNIGIDILTDAVPGATFEEMQPHTMLVGGIRVLKFEYALAVKLKCLYLRQDDDNGLRKRKSDAQDIEFLCEKMAESSELISDECAEKFRFGYYHTIEIRMCVNPESFQTLIELGIGKFVIPWAENTLEQREYYCYFAEEGMDPLTVPLEMEEDVN